MKKTLALLLVACMVLTMVPFMAFAASSGKSVPAVADPGNYHLINQMAGLTVADWTGVKVSGAAVDFSSDAAAGSFRANAHGYGKSRIEYSASKFALGQGNFTFSAKISQGGGYDNSFRPYETGNSWDNLYYGIDVGGLELRMLAYSIPVLYYNGTFITAGDALVEPMYQFDYNTGKFTEVDGAPVAAVNGEGTALYASHDAYKQAVQAAKLFYVSQSTLTIKVEGNTVIGQLIDGAGTAHDLLTAALPDGALAEPAAVAVTFSNVNWWSSAAVYGADLVSDKLIVTLAPSISAPTFSADEWTIEEGRSGQDDSAYNASIEDTKIITGNSSYLITNNNTYTGDKFLLTYSARKRDYGNMDETGIGAAMQIGDLYFGLNKGRMTPFVMYKGEIIYQSNTKIYEYVADTALIDELNALAFAGNNGRANTWTRKEGKATYTAKFDNGRFVMTYESSNYGKAEIVNIDVSAKVTSFTDAAVSIKGSVGAWDSCDIFELVNLVYSDEAFDIGYLNAVVGSMADYADYNNYPAEFKQLATLYRFVPAYFKSLITNFSVVEAYDAEYSAYHKLGSITLDTEIFLDGFVQDEWSVVTHGGWNGAWHKFFTSENISNRLQHEGSDNTISTAGTFNLTDTWKIRFAAFGGQYNGGAGQYFAWNVGNYKIKFDISTLQYVTVTVETLNGDVLAASEPVALTRIDAMSSDIQDPYIAEGKPNNDYGGVYEINYANGNITVSIDDADVVTAALDGADFSAAEIQFASLIGWRQHNFFNMLVSGNAETINLFDFNAQLGTLATAEISADYNALAAKADIVLPKLSQEQLSAMYNIAVYEQYKADYARYILNSTITSKNIIFDYASGLYQNEFVTPVDGAKYVRNNTYPTGAILTGTNNTIVSATFKNRLYTDDYFVISSKNVSTYNRYYNEYAVGELAIRLVYDDDNNTPDNEQVSIVIFMNGTEIYRKYTGLSASYMGCQWYVTYDKGVMKVTYDNYGIKEADTVNLTTLDGWDANYTPNGKQVAVTVKSTWNASNNMPRISNFSIKARANADMFDAFNALALTDDAAAKNIYETLPASANEYITAEALAAVNGDFSLVKENTTVTSDIAPYRYGDTVTFTATVDTNKYDFDGWYDAEGNCVSNELSYSATILPNMTLKAKAVGLRFTAGSLTLEDNLSLNFKVPSSLFAQGKYTAPYVVFSRNGFNKTVSEYTVSGDYYVFTFTRIAPQEMSDTVTATLYANDNEGTLRSSEPVSLSARDYCYYQLNNNSNNETLRKLIVDLLNYGAEAQNYTSYNTNALVNKDLTSEQAAWGTTNALRPLNSALNTKFTAIQNPSVIWKGAGLRLDDSVVMRFKIKTADINGLTVKVTDETNTNVLAEISYDTFKATADGCYYVYFDGFNAGQMSEAVLVTVYNGENAVSHTIRYSIESYACSKLNTPGTNVNLENLLTAMMKYGDAAAAYKESLS